jgi:hypothetical protein
MSRATQADIRQVETVINAELARSGSSARVTVEWAYGQPRAYVTDVTTPYTVQRELSYRLPMGQMLAWLDAFATGLCFLSDHAPQPQPKPAARHIRIWSQDDFTLYLLPPNAAGKCAYALYDDGTPDPIFSGADYGPSPLHPWASDLSVAGLLVFLSLQPGDTDDEYFADYTPAQLAWVKARGEELGLLASEMKEAHRE